MIYGEYRDRFPRVLLSLPGRASAVEVEFIVDTGFDGALTLPGSVLRQLNVRPFSVQKQLLADGSELESLVYRVTLIWDREERDVEVLAIDNNPLLGTFLLEGSHLDIEAKEGGEVTIEPLM